MTLLRFELADRGGGGRRQMKMEMEMESTSQGGLVMRPRHLPARRGTWRSGREPHNCGPTRDVGAEAPGRGWVLPDRTSRDFGTAS